jgi:hypothetical protein
MREHLLERIADGRTNLVFEARELGVAPTASARGPRLREWCALLGEPRGSRA